MEGDGRGPTTKEQLDACTVGGARRHGGPIVLAEYDAAWPQVYDREADRIRSILTDTALRIEHVGSTSVPGLVAKPIIDIVLVVANSADEASYVLPLESHGYRLRIREPEWLEHRMLKGPSADINLHVFSDGCAEVARMIRFRDHLRSSEADRELYMRKKRELATRSWEYVQNYADAKTEVIQEILARAGQLSS